MIQSTYKMKLAARIALLACPMAVTVSTRKSFSRGDCSGVCAPRSMHITGLPQSIKRGVQCEHKGIVCIYYHSSDCSGTRHNFAASARTLIDGVNCFKDTH